MSYIQDIDFDFHTGDQFDLSPAEGSYVIGKLLAVGAEFYIDGNTIIVSAVPGELPVAPAPAPVEAPEIPAAVEETPPPAELSPAEDLAAVEEAVVEVVAPVAEVEASDEVVETPIKRTRKPKAAPAPAPVVEAPAEESAE